MLYFLFTILCQETLKTSTNRQNDRAYTVVTNLMALLVAAFMLYMRLGDAIEGVVARTTHDYYVLQKRKDFLPLYPTERMRPFTPAKTPKIKSAGSGGEGASVGGEERDGVRWLDSPGTLPSPDKSSGMSLKSVSLNIGTL